VNTSSPPPSGVMKPKPFELLNHLTVPIAMSNHPKVVLKYWANACMHENQDRATDRTEIPTTEEYSVTSKALFENPAGASVG
jgi:hypothetical protein